MLVADVQNQVIRAYHLESIPLTMKLKWYTLRE